MLKAVRAAVSASQHKIGKHPKGCFQFFGFDFIMDSSMWPWLLEANCNPALCTDAGPSVRNFAASNLTSMLKLVLGLNNGEVRLPNRYGSLNEAVDGAGK